MFCYRREIARLRAIGIGACISWGAICPADAQQTPSCPPNTRTLSSRVGYGEGLSFNECVRRADAALRQDGFEPKQSKESIYGIRGDYLAQIICAPKQVIVWLMLGPNDKETDLYLNSVVKAFSQKR
jgi:hypothetical protein